ncbi:MAG: hypothetical protein KC492_02880, partial [Myxococcales bacterium]|nr:hypothetical protein [Myxococcales bacterium]
VTAAPSLPEDLMLLLAADPDHDVRRHLACRRDITTAVTEVLLAQACDGRTLQTLATNASLPTATLAALAQKEPLQEDRGPGWFARRIRSPWPTSSGDVRALLAARSGLPSEWLETFARDADWQVRAAVAANPDSSEALLDSLLDDEQSPVRLELARNPSFSSLELLATDPEPSVCLALAHRADLPAETLELLARDANAGVRAAIASRKDTPRALLEVLLRDSQAQVRQAANTALGAEPVLTPFNRVPALQIRGVLLTHAPSSRATKPVPAPPPAPAKPSGSESGLRKVLEQWGIAVEPVLHVVNTVGSSNVLFGAGTLTQELQLLVPTHGDLRSSLTPKTSIPEPSTLLIKYRGSAPPCVALVIGGPTTLRAAIVEVSPQGNADAWHAVLDGLPPFSIENRIRYVSEARGAVTCSFGTRTDVESEATFSAALENLAQRLGLDQAWRGVYAEAGAGTGVSVTTECTPNGLSRQLSLRFGGTNWDRAIDLVGALVDKPATRSAAVRMGTIAGSLGVEELRNIEVVLSTGAADLIAWFPGSA